MASAANAARLELHFIDISCGLNEAGMVPGDRNAHPYANPHAPHGNRPELPQSIRTHRKMMNSTKVTQGAAMQHHLWFWRRRYATCPERVGRPP
jgi:hypothetical protein